MTSFPVFPRSHRFPCILNPRNHRDPGGIDPLTRSHSPKAVESFALVKAWGLWVSLGGRGCRKSQKWVGIHWWNKNVFDTEMITKLYRKEFSNKYWDLSNATNTVNDISVYMEYMDSPEIHKWNPRISFCFECSVSWDSIEMRCEES